LSANPSALPVENPIDAGAFFPINRKRHQYADAFYGRAENIHVCAIKKEARIVGVRLKRFYGKLLYANGVHCFV
jgi:hypothetical protein